MNLTFSFLPYKKLLKDDNLINYYRVVVSMGIIDSFKKSYEQEALRKKLIEDFRLSFGKKPRITFKRDNTKFVEERYPDDTELHDWIKYQLLFYKPLNFDTRYAANSILNQHDRVDSGRLLWDELTKLKPKTQETYSKIINIFENEFNPDKESIYQFERPQLVFDYITGIFAGQIEYDEKKLDETISDENWRNAYKNYYAICKKECKKYMEKNEVSNYVRDKKAGKKVKENKDIEAFLKRLDDTITEFLDHRPMGEDIYKIAVSGIKVEN